ncbi:MAG: SAM-dependent methyltransferase [Gammaproteobacteria bacterium]
MHPSDAYPSTGFLLALALISAATLAYEILLMRLFSIIQWHHFAYMIISLALLGYGASGALLTLIRKAVQCRFALAFVLNGLLLAASSIVCYLLAQHTGFNPLELVWDQRQWGRLGAVYTLLLLPFLFSANCVCLALMHFKRRVNLIYAADLVGAGLGATGVIGLLSFVFPLTALALISVAALAASALAAKALGMRRYLTLAMLVVGGFLILAIHATGAWRIAPLAYKSLSQTLQGIGTRVLTERSSPLGLLTVVESPRVPFRHAPGMSLNALTEPPQQLGVFTDGEGMSAITRFDGKREKLAYLDQVPSALAYHLLAKPRVLILGAGGGADVLQGIYFGAPHIDAVELNPQIVALVRGQYARFAGGIYAREGVRLHIADARGFLSRSKEHYDLIQVPPLDAFTTASAGLYALNETYANTVEAVQSYLHHLAPGGLIAFTRWVRIPPREDLKLFATVVQALRALGIPQAERRIAWVRGWNASVLLVKNGLFTAQEVGVIRDFCRARWFDTDYIFGIKGEDTNRYNRLERPLFYEAATAVLGSDSERFLRDYKFNVAPATDDRPYFFHFFKWSVFPELLGLREVGGLALLDLGYVVLVATLIQAVSASVLLIVLPLGIRIGRRSGRQNKSRRVLAYFFAIGLAFIFIEVAFIQKLILYLAHPLYAVSVVLAGFLVFAGMGSALTQGVAACDRKRALGRVVAALGSIVLVYLLGWPIFFALSGAALEWIRVLLALSVIAPLALFMGMPFPLGLAGFTQDGGELTAWAWGINGCASVVGAVLATLVSVHLGINAVLITACFLYVLAWACAP